MWFSPKFITRSKGLLLVGGSRATEQRGGATKLRPYKEGRARMAAEAHNGGCSPSVNPTKVAYPLDDLARGLPSGSLVQGVPNYSRRKT
jgi:hypothetical protein